MVEVGDSVVIKAPIKFRGIKGKVVGITFDRGVLKCEVQIGRRMVELMHYQFDVVDTDGEIESRIISENVVDAIKIERDLARQKLTVNIQSLIDDLGYTLHQLNRGVVKSRVGEIDSLIGRVVALDEVVEVVEEILTQGSRQSNEEENSFNVNDWCYRCYKFSWV